MGDGGGIFPCLRVKCFNVGGGNISLLEVETFPVWGGECFPAKGGNLSLLEWATFPCLRGKHFPFGGEIFPVEGGMFPCFKVKRFDVGGENISLLESGGHLAARGGNVSLLKGEMIPCCMG